MLRLTVFFLVIFGLLAQFAFCGRVRRRLDEFGEMIMLTTSRSPMDFNGYGNFCGYGGSGDPVDPIDQCCKVHDNCYQRLNRKECDALLKYRVYTTEYKWSFKDGTIICNELDSCAHELCECDRVAATCFGEHEQLYDPENKHNALLFGIKQVISKL
ncbi:acidic phospholipase A2 Cc1-PLA2-like isoform X2 [Mya arenaria]|nr:acidic phospholipase A2 Cc1-PLA2-like isoform X2 [Mya arenaria]XP_052791176.1 acidic phospholipase A2 Cc1-PLA2-like isoform X2 [Mya arenaria]